MKFEMLKEKVQKNPVFSSLLLIGAILAFLAGIISNLTTIGNFISTTFFPKPVISNTLLLKNEALKNVEGLAPGVNINVYQNTFGQPRFINHDGAKQRKEYVFVNTYFYLDAVTDMNDNVQIFALSIRDRTFNPIFKSPGYPLNQPSFQITLGRSKLSDVPGQPEYVSGCLGARTYSYYETRYLGNPGDYEDFGFGFSEAGYLPSNADFSGLNNTSQFCPGTSNFTGQDLQTLQNLRTQTPFNTYAVSAPGLSIKDYANSNLGVNYDQVRTLNS